MMIIPEEVKSIIEKLEKEGFQAYIVGGCLRDILRKKEPKDWDIATDAKPEQVVKIFPKNYTDNKFGTVKVLTKSKKIQLKEIEVTTFRTEEKYTDKRHPDKVKWAKTIEEDLSRRDFTINAMALGLDGKIVDPFHGENDLKKKIIKTVGKPEERFKEDALRLMRAIRFATTFNFQIEEKTFQEIKKNSGLLEFISKERIRDELIKIIMTEKAFQGIEFLRETNLLKYIIPELLEGYKIGQNKHHIYDIYDHSLKSLDYSAKKNFNLYVRIASLLHDIGKPKTKEGEGKDSTFYNHEIVGAKITAQILNRLRFSKRDIEKIVKLVRYHLFYYNVDEVTESSVRRLLRRVGKENIDELIQIRMADRIGSGCPKALPYKLRHFQYVIDKVSQDPIDVKKLKINGSRIMEILKIEPGPKIGRIFNVLLTEILDNPEKNKKKHLEDKVKELGELSDSELDKISRKSGRKINEIIEKRDQMTKTKYWVS